MKLMIMLMTSLFFNITTDAFDYEAAWKEVQEKINNGLPQDALAKTIEIYAIADKEGNALQKTKATAYLASMTLSTNEDGLTKANEIFKNEIAKAKAPYKQIIHSYYGQFLENYFQNNRYVISQRTQTSDDGNLLTMTSQPLIEKIKEQYNMSLENPDLLRKEIKEFSPLLNEYNEDGRLRNPELYEVLASRALQFYISTPSYSTDFSILDLNKNYFSTVEQFIKIKIEGDNQKSEILKKYQEILSHEFKTNKLVSLAYFDLMRMRYVYENSTDSDKISLYEAALKNEIILYKNLEISTEYQAELASLILSSMQPQKNQKAKKLCEFCLMKFPKTPGAVTCKNILANIVAKEINILTESVYQIGSPLKYKVATKNVKKLFFKIVNNPNIEVNEESEKMPLINNQKIITKWSQDILIKEEFVSTHSFFDMEALVNGNYIMVASDKEDFSGAFYIINFQVSNLAYIGSTDEKGNYFLVVDRKNGKPIKGAEVEFFEQSYDYTTRKSLTKKVGNATTDKDGKVYSPSLVNKSYKLKIKKGKDFFDGIDYHYDAMRNEPNQSRQGIEIFTDRSIYRPGQVVYFKAISLNYDKDGRPSIMPNNEVKFILNDSNGQEVSNVSLKTNDYGSASGSFTLPSGRLTGYYYIQSIFGGTNIRVEEYKRPTFEVKFDTIRQAYKIGDDVMIKGNVKAFAGNGISNAKVEYLVMRKTVMPYCYRYYNFDNIDQVIATGKLIANANGEFEITFKSIDGSANGIYPINVYEISATAVDETGESQTGQYSISLSKKSLFIEENIPDGFDVNDKLNTALTVKNILGEKMKENGTYVISKLIEDINILVDNIWGESDQTFKYQNPISGNKFANLVIEKQVKKDNFISGDNLNLSGLTSGIYKIEANLINGQADTLTEYFVVTDFAKKKLPQSKYVHHLINKKSFIVGEKVQIDLGASIEKQQVYYLLNRGSKVLKQGWLSVANTAKLDYVITDTDKGGLMLQYIFIYNNRTYNQIVDIAVPWVEKDLMVTYENFRDKLLPGAQTDFKIKISGKNKDKVQAELLAAMYDASLDQIQPHLWNRILFQNNYGYLPLQGFYFGLAFGSELNYAWNQSDINNETIYPILPDLIGFQYQGYSTGAYGGSRTRMMKRGVNENDQMAAEVSPPPHVAQSANALEEGALKQTSGGSNLPPNPPPFDKSNSIVTPRLNLKETVFFYPHLKTDKEGNTIIAFKMNEAITKWKLMTFAHTKELATAYDEKYIQTKKDLMIVANSPRFIREGDEIFFTARVTNLSDMDLNTSARLDLVDGLKDTPANQLITSEVSIQVALKKGESKAVNWKIKIPDGNIDLLKYTVSAVSGNFTDGESSVIPILSNRILITESMAMYIKGNEKKTYEFKSMKEAASSQKPYKYTVEISSHPIWYAIQAIPYIIEQEGQSATQLAARYYVNNLSKHIIKQYPQIQEVFTQWQIKDKDALKSNLEKNADLKNAMLEETPWVVDALNEAKQKGNIARIFDTNTVNADLAQTLAALQALQLPDGSFTWFPGGRSDYYSTKYVVEMLGKTAKLDETGQAVNIASPALTFLDLELARGYAKLKEDYAKNKLKLEDYQPSEDIIHHLYVRSMFPIFSRQNESDEAYNFYQKQALKYWTKYDIFTQSLLGLVDFRSKGNTYKEISKSILQKSFKSDELGTYWNAGNGYRWYELPIERHAAIMDFLHETNHDAASLDEMKIWLLKNKQSNHWSTGKSTAAAISALLLQRGPKQANLDNDLAVIAKVGDESLPNNADIQAGTAYYKKAWTGSEINKAKANIQLSNPNENIAWGGAYYQYFEDVNKVVGTNASPLKIEKQLYKETNDSKGKSLVLIDAKNKLMPGEVLVSRLIITSDRDMDYIHLKDLRASGLEPSSSLSGYKWSGGFGFYESIRDLATHYYIDHLPKGKHVFESRQKVVHRGTYSGGLATIQSFYAPEFGGKTEGNMLKVE